ncbi:uncharacterized protein KY384_000479 [Bacidia gigantensis]|uniref:uncharacterized protein n=1 Tax=Bacidia gigantensis TaxID=2732470 RepID=UPI001D03830C|nr:uncharacterized protein KY384_000479 [Bacidia gigantensis]KAG8525719.1 hypothetical protein KY384_000479 [Bacidia gigantensis]
MFRWLTGPGKVFKFPLPRSTNYMNAYDENGGLLRANNLKPIQKEDQNELPNGTLLPDETASDLMPYPLNRDFKSQRVLSEGLKDEIYKRVMENGQDVGTVSVSLEVEIRRVAAVVRLKALEKRLVDEGKPLAIPYAKAVMSMLPKTPYIASKPLRHEPINDLPVHQATTPQIFHPTSESRHFTRTDAGKAFKYTLLPADKRIPHPKLVEAQIWHNEGLQKEEVAARQKQNKEVEENFRLEKERARKAREESTTTTAETARSVYRFKEVSVEQVGQDGRGRGGVGARYGMPHQDRKKGQIKIPVRVS